MYKSQFLREHIVWCWKTLVDNSSARAALFGAGRHSVWLIEVLQENNLRLPVFIIDENSALKEISGIPVLKPQETEIEKADIIFLSTDVHQEKLSQRLKLIFPELNDKKIINFYEGFPPGPYEKNIGRPRNFAEKFKPQLNHGYEPEKPLNICISRPLKSEPSESFIKAHLTKIPGRIFGLFGSWMPVYTEDDMVLATGCKTPEESLLAFLKDNRVDVFLAEYGLTGAEVCETCEKAKIPLVVYFLGFDANDKNYLESYHEKYQTMFKKAYAFVTVSEEMRQKVIALGADPMKVHNIPCGVDLTLYSEKPQTPQFTKPVFLALGRFVDKKAPHLTILAFKLVHDIIPAACLVYYGDGELMEVCRSIVRALDLGNSVDLRGYCKHHELPAIMAASSVFVQHSVTTSYGDSEGSPVIIIEAGMAGLPVVSTKHAGIKEIVLDGESGLLVDEYDINGMAEAMIKFIKDPNLMRTAGQRAREHIMENYSMDKNIRKLYSLLREAALSAGKNGRDSWHE